LCFCPFVFLSFCLFFVVFFVFLSGHHADQMSEGPQFSKVTLCVKILKWPDQSIARILDLGNSREN